MDEIEQNISLSEKISLVVGSKLDVRYVGDDDEKIYESWHIATVVEAKEDAIKIRYDSEIDSDEDEWIDAKSLRVQSLHKYTKQLSSNLPTRRNKIRYEMSIADWNAITKPPSIDSFYNKSKYLYYYSKTSCNEYVIIIAMVSVDNYSNANEEQSDFLSLIYKYDIKANKITFLFPLPFEIHNILFNINPTNGDLYILCTDHGNKCFSVYNLEDSSYRIKCKSGEWNVQYPNLQHSDFISMILGNKLYIKEVLRDQHYSMLLYDEKANTFERIESVVSSHEYTQEIPMRYNLHLDKYIYFDHIRRYVYGMDADGAIECKREDMILPHRFQINNLKHVVSFGGIITFHFMDEEDKNRLLFIDVNDWKIYECSHSLGWNIQQYEHHMFVTMDGILHAINFDKCNESELQLNLPPFHMNIELKDIVPNELFNKYNGIYFNVAILIEGYIRSIDQHRISFFSLDVLRIIHCYFVIGA